MISFKRSMDSMADQDERLRAFRKAYTGTVLALQNAAGILAPEGPGDFPARLQAIRQRLERENSPAQIVSSGDSVDCALDTFSGCIKEMRDRKESEFKQIIHIVADAAAAIIGNGTAQSEEIRQFASKIEADSRLESITEIRRQLSMRSVELKRLAETVQQDTLAHARTLERKLRKTQQKLIIAETLAETDPLTGLGNRRRADHAMRSAIEAGMPCSLLLFDLNGFKGVNDRHGHLQGDQLLKRVARELERCVRDFDIVCRWGGDEFVILLPNAPISAAASRAAYIEKNAFGEFVLDHGITIQITATVGIAEHQAGESAQEFFERADQLLYQQKAERDSRARSSEPAVTAQPSA